MKYTETKASMANLNPNISIIVLNVNEFKSLFRASGQDGGIGRHTVPPRTTRRMTTTI